MSGLPPPSRNVAKNRVVHRVHQGVPPPEPSDHHLLDRFARRGDRDAFHRLIERHQLRLVRLAHAILGQDDAALEAVDEGFLRLAHHADEVLANARQEGLGGWLCTVVRNAAIDLVRKGRGPVVLPLDDRDDDGAGVLAAAASADTGSLLWREVADLPPLERAAVVLRYRDGLAYQEIAGQLGKSVDHVGVILHTAISRLRRSPTLRAEVLS